MTKSGNFGSTTTQGKSGEKVDCSKSIVHSEIKLSENKKFLNVWLPYNSDWDSRKGDYEWLIPIKPETKSELHVY